MSHVGKSGSQRWLMPLLIALFAVVAVLGGRELIATGQFNAPTNVLFEADCSRVVQNSTDVTGEQGRARLHPLHVLVAAPLGTLLSRFMAPQLATVLITALAGAGLLYHVERILAEQLSLPLIDRLLITALLGVSATQITFSMVPDTHLLSAFALSGMARTLAPSRLARLRQASGPPLEWLKEGGVAPVLWSAFGIGMLGTNAVAAVQLHFLQSPSPLRTRLWRSALWTAAAMCVVFALHMTQRKLWPPGPYVDHTASALAVHPKTGGAARVEIAPTVRGPRVTPFSAPPPAHVRPADLSLATLGDYVKWVWTTNTRFLTRPVDWPLRVLELLPAFFWVPFFAPRFGVTPKPNSVLPGATFEPLDLDFRLPGTIGLVLATLLVLRLLAAAKTEPVHVARPLLLYCAGLIGTYLFIISWYGDEAFLFSPNWVFATVLIASSIYASALKRKPRLQLLARASLAVIVALMGVNSLLHLRDVITYVS